jgi:hypothetical protein
LKGGVKHMPTADQFELRANPNGAHFHAGESRSLPGTAEEVFDLASTFENLAFSGTLVNPSVALNRAHDLLKMAVQQETGG